MTLKLADNAPPTPDRKAFVIVAKDKSADVFIYEDIGDGLMGGISAKDFADNLNALGKLDTINVYINSGGGSVFDGVAMYNVLVRNSARVNVRIDGLAASIASVVAMAGDEISIAANGMMMIHNPWTLTAGTASDLRTTADRMDRVRDTLIDTYAARTKQDRASVGKMMDGEKWMNADEAVALGFADKKTQELKFAAYYDLSRFKNAPTIQPNPAEPAKPEAGLRDQIADAQLAVYQLRQEMRQTPTK